MKEKLSMCAILICFFFITSVLADNSGTEIHFTDASGREITLDKPADRIGFSSYSVAEAIKLIGAWDKVVARDGYISDPKFYPNLDSIPAISVPNGMFDLDFEKIIEIKPDVVILPVSKNTKQETLQQIIDTLEPEIPVVYLDFGNPDNFSDNIIKLGEITGENEGAQKYLDFYNDIITTISDATSHLSDEERPNVFMKAAGYTPDQLCSYGKEASLWNQMCTISGGNSISENLPSAWTQVDPEWLLDKRIDVLIGECWDSFYPESFGYTATNPSEKITSAENIITNISSMEIFSNTDAVAEGNVYLIHDPLTNTPRFIVGIAYLAKWLHPDLFENLDPKQIHQDYLNNYIGADYDLNTVGLDAYPQS